MQEFDIKVLKSNILSLRLRNQLTLSQVAEKVKVTREAYIKWEQDPDRIPGLEYVANLSRLYKVSIDDIVFGHIEMPIIQDMQNNDSSDARNTINDYELYTRFYNELRENVANSIKTLKGKELKPFIIQTTEKYIAYKTYSGKTPLHFLTIYPNKRNLRLIFSIPFEQISHNLLSYSPMNASLTVVRKQNNSGLLVEGKYDVNYEEIVKICRIVIEYVMKKKGVL